MSLNVLSMRPGAGSILNVAAAVFPTLKLPMFIASILPSAFLFILKNLPRRRTNTSKPPSSMSFLFDGEGLGGLGGLMRPYGEGLP